MKNSNLKRRFTRYVGSASAVLLLSGTLTGCKDDLLTGMPEWLGESVYAELERRGNFKETLKLINAQDEDYATVLAKTGSKTVFVADDEAWAKFYANNPWGVKSIDDMTLAQKKLLFKGNIINSAYLVELLGNIPAANSTSDPVEGACMRRATSVDLSDSIPVISAEKFPVVNPARFDAQTLKQTDYWSEVRDRDSLIMFMDDNVATMIHFMPKFMLNNNITDDDVTFMTNGDITSNEGAFVNGKAVTEADITCQNGYIHVMNGVGVPMDNMANVIANQPQFSIYSRLLDRFSYPKFDRDLTARYGGENHDSVFVKRYFNKSDGKPLNQMDNGTKVTTLLPYDPGWNRYIMDNQSRLTFQHDAAMMLVPTDEAMLYYLDHDGSDLRDRYGTEENNGYDAWDNAPDAVVLPLLENTMHTSLKAAIPSAFGSINNTAADPMNVKKEDINFTHWACNGIVYETNKVYVAPDYVSVYYPCVIRGNEDLSYIYAAIEKDNQTKGAEGFKAYLNNMGSKYTFIIPNDSALKRYYDPVSRFRYDAQKNSTAIAYNFYVNKDGNIAADPYQVDWTTLDEYGRGTIGEVDKKITLSAGGITTDVMNHVKDIIYSSMAVGTFKPDQKFYLAKNGAPIIVDWEGDKVRGVAGSFQYERGYFIPIAEKEVFDKTIQGNGVSYVISQDPIHPELCEPLQSTTLSPFTAITDTNKVEFQAFAELLKGCNFIGSDDHAGHVTQDRAITCLSNFNYTIYVPKNEGVRKLIDDHRLPTFEDRDKISEAVLKLQDLMDAVKDDMDDYDNYDTVQWNAYNDEMQYLMKEDTVMSNVIENFVSYHIQDNSIFIDGEEHSNSAFESACLDTATTRYAKIFVDYTHGGQMKITDNNGKVHFVDDDPEMHNIMARQYHFNKNTLSGNGAATQIFSSAFVVIHSIDTPMEPFRDGDVNHPNNGYYSPAEYAKVMAIVDKYYTEIEPEPEPEPDPVNVKRHKR